jgi:hypothetical protein
MLYLLVLAVTAFIAGIGIESGGLLVETGVAGEANGAFSRLLVLYIIFVMSSLWGFEACLHSRKGREPGPARLLLSRSSLSCGFALSLISVSAGVAAGFTNGFAFLEGVNRYAARNAGGAGTGEILFNVFLNNELFVALFLGTAVTSANRTVRLAALILIAADLSLSVLHGEQFMSVLHFCLSVVTPVVAIRVLNGMPVTRHLCLGIGAALLIGGCSVFFAYEAQGYDAMQLLESRVLLQGQAWFVVDSDAQIFSAPIQGGAASFQRFISSLFAWSTPAFSDYAHTSGLRDLMIAYGLPRIMNAYVIDDVTFTMGQMAVPVFWFGYAGGAIFVAVGALIYGALCAWQIEVVLGGGVVMLWLIAKVISYATFALQQGEYWSMFGSRMFFYATVALIWWFYVECRLPSVTMRGRRLS